MRKLPFILLTLFLLVPSFVQSPAEGATPDSIVLQPVGQIGGPTQAVMVREDYAYAGVGQRLVVLDISDPTMLQEIGATQPFEGFVEGVTVVDDITYVACGSAGLHLVNVSNPTYPTQVAVYDSPGYAEGVAIAGQHAYVADGWGGLRVVDISDPAHPAEVGYVHTLGYAFDVAVAGNYAYVAGAGAGLRVVDISDPADPAEVGFHNTPGYAHDVAVADDTAFIADEWEGLRVVDVSEPTSPIEVGCHATPGQAFGVAVEGGTAYVADAFKGLRVIDISSPSSPEELGAYEVKGHAGMVVVAGNRAYVADRNNGLRIIDVSNRSSPTQVGFYSPLGYAEGVAVSGNCAYVAAGPYGLRIVDISNPAKPRQIGQYDSQGFANRVSVVGNYAYVTTLHGLGPEGMYIVDVSNPNNPTRVSFFDKEYGPYRDLAVSGETAYLADEWGLSLIDISDPLNPFQSGFIDLMMTLGHATCGLDVSGTLAYVAQAQEGVKIVDVSNPQNLTLIGVFKSEWNFCLDVTLVGDRAYLADGGLRVLDVSNPASPIEMGSFDTPGHAEGVALEGGIAYVANSGSGVFAVDVSNPYNLNLITQYNTSGSACGVIVKDNLLYVADGKAGLLILEMVPSSGLNRQVVRGSLEPLINYPQIVKSHVSPRPWRITGSEQAGRLSSSLATNIPDNISPDTLVVTTTADSGEGSFRWCLENAQHGDTITFDDVIFPPDNSATISLATPLPAITQGNITIDASDAGVILKGNELPDGTSGLKLDSDGNIMRGLQILFFPSGGIDIRSNGNIVGGDRAKGEGPVGQGNVISGNGGDGIQMWGNENTVIGNLIGTDASGSGVLGNGGLGIHVFGCNNRIGGAEPWERNIISGNEECGVSLHFDGANGNSVMGNYIGTDISGSYDLGNQGDGVGIVQGAFNNLVEHNLISGNSRAGVCISDAGSSYNTVISNLIGIDASGTLPIANDECGVFLGYWGASFNRVGGTSPEERNIISGNPQGIGLSGGLAVNNIVIGNYIGTDLTGTQPIGNNGSGISASGEQDFIGGMTAEERNVISGNSCGISLEGNCNFIAGNYIGTDASGTIALGNNKFGIGIWRTAGHNAIQYNLVSGNEEGGIRIEIPGVGDNIVFHNNFVDNRQNGFDNMGTNFWDHDGEGNYWSDYAGEDADGDGIGDTPYEIPGDAGARDNYPLVQPQHWNQLPDQPSSTSLANGATDVSLTPTMLSSAFSDSEGDTHTASQWQITTTVGDYSNAIFDSGADNSNLTSIAIPSKTLSYNTTYYWRVRHQDNNGAWSSYSEETSFHTETEAAPPAGEEGFPWLWVGVGIGVAILLAAGIVLGHHLTRG